ncbi:ABC transporter permease [Paenibacillus eucommiae]|uniref:Simple sugar transport system permease protein n=1 Tax=Paenibacillus eucommiae TaxID=1355755 RepID=A0ABS4IS74_9BACL|nr:ABC transporter permease [Paenibacillus eucommiae]MBP1990427.1 simple sugar transport system permease protein [Paenibacillus eucommiae]
MDIPSILTTLVHNAVVYATPLIFAALGGVFSEKSGVTNIGLEGLMIVGGFSAAVTTIFCDDVLGFGSFSPWIGLAMGLLIGVLFSLQHAVVSITFKADQVISGVALNLLALGFSIYMMKKLFDGSSQTTTMHHPLNKLRIPYLSDIPYLGKAVFTAYPTSYIAILLTVLAAFILFKTPFGLRLRSVGEHPKAADTLGVNVNRMRYIAVLISGALAGLGGATISLSITNNFTQTTVSGQGFIAMAAMIFGRWNPIGALGAALFFGLAQALAAISQVLGLTKYVPADLLTMLPYIITIIAITGLVGRSEAPSALGKSYEKGQR